MAKYIPFLKFKQNEILALGELTADVRDLIHPFFDVPRTSKNQSEADIFKRLECALTSLKGVAKKVNIDGFYIDNFDLDDAIRIAGQSQYQFILNYFSAFNPVPVIAFDRNNPHNLDAFFYLSTHPGVVALRLQRDDLESFKLSKPKIFKAYADAKSAGATAVHLIIDLRVIEDWQSDLALVKSFLQEFFLNFSCGRALVTGSVIPANITGLVQSSSEQSVERLEKKIWNELSKTLPVNFGDYGVVSPDYSDIELKPELFRSISTPKIFYPYQDMLYALRGSSFKSHAKGNGQFFDMADKLVSKPFFRSHTYSYGEKYAVARSYLAPALPSKAGSQGSWIKAMLCSHITYTVRSI